MATTVQAPERADATVTGLQPTARPQERGVGSFLSGLIEPASQAVDKYQEDNAGHLRALGQNDVLNNKFSEVNSLGQKAYAEGRTFQTVVNSRAVLTKDFKEKVAASKDPAEWEQYIREYSDATVQNIKEANLPNSVKEKLYEAQLANNATYMSMIDKQTTKVIQDQEFETRQVEAATLYDDFQNTPMNAEEIIATSTAHYERHMERGHYAYPDKSDEDLKKEWEADYLAVLDLVFEGVDPKVDIESAQRINIMKSVVDELPFVSIAAAQKYKEKATKFSADFVDANFTQGMAMVEEANFQAKMDPNSVTPEELGELLVYFDSSDVFSPEQKLQARKALNGIHYDQQKSLHSGKGIPNAASMSKSDVLIAGVSEKEVLDTVQRDLLLEDPLTAGYRMIQKYGMGAEVWDEGINRGVELAVGTFLPYMNFTDAEVKDTEYSGNQLESFKLFSNMYNRAASANSTLANQLLAGIPNEQREVFISALESGQSLEWVRRRLANNATTKAEYDNVNKAVDGITAEHLGVGGLINKFVGNTGGMNTSAQEAFVSRAKIIGGSSVNSFVKKMSSPSPRAAGVLLQQQQIPSPEGLSPVLANSRADRIWTQLATTGEQPINKAYVGSIVDDLRIRESEARNMNPNNTVAYFDDTGSNLVIEFYESEGIFSGGDGSRNDILTYRSDDILQGARDLYSKDKTRKTNPTPQQRLEQDSVREVGTIAMDDRVSGRPVNVPITVSMSKNFGQNANVTAAVLGDIAYWYGATSQPLTQQDGTVAAGIGLSSKTMPTWAIEKLERASTNSKDSPEQRNKRIMQTQAEIMTQVMRGVDINDAYERVGIPKPTQDMYPSKDLKTLSTLYTAGLLYGNDGLNGNTRKGIVGAVDLFTAKDYDTAMNMFHKSKLYVPNTKPRIKHYLRIMKDHYKRQGK